MDKETFRTRLLALGFKTNAEFAAYIGVGASAVSTWFSVRKVPLYVIRIIELLEKQQKVPTIDSTLAKLIQEAIFKGGVQSIVYNSQSVNVTTSRNGDLVHIVAILEDTLLIDVWLDIEQELHYTRLSQLTISALIEATYRLK